MFISFVIYDGNRTNQLTLSQVVDLAACGLDDSRLVNLPIYVTENVESIQSL